MTLPGLCFCTRKDSCFNHYLQVTIVYSLGKMSLAVIYSLGKCSHLLFIRLKKCNRGLFIRSKKRNFAGDK